MHFLYPFMLWGLTATAVPVIIHLFRLRRFKTVLFSNTRMLRDVQLETKRKSRLKHLLILLLRILALASLVFAFARPFLPVGENDGQQQMKTVLLYIDNSFSMEAGESYHSRLDVAKNKALEIAEGFGPDVRFLLLSNQSDASSFRTLTQKELFEKIAELSTGPFTMNFNDVILKFSEISLQNAITNSAGVIISDFQQGFFDTEELPDSLAFPVFLVPVAGPPVVNAGIDSVWLDSPVLRAGSPVLVQARIRNYSQELYEALTVELFVNDSRRSVASCDVAPGGFAVVEMTFVPDKKGIYSCFLMMKDSPVIYDDKMFFSFDVADETKVLAISGKPALNKSLTAVFANEPLFLFSSDRDKNVEYGRISASDIVILDAVDAPSDGLIQELGEFVRTGGSLVIIPPASENIVGLNKLMGSLGLDTYETIVSASLRISSLNSEHELFQGVFDGIPRDMDLPSVKKYFSMRETGTGWKLPLMKLQNNTPFLIMSSAGEGTVYYFICPFDQKFTDFHQHALVVPTFYQMAFISKKQTNIAYTIGNNEAIVFKSFRNAGENTYRIKNKEGSVDFIPQIRNDGSRVFVFPHHMISEADNYFVYDSDTALTGFAMNYTRSESVMKFSTPSQLDSLIRSKGLTNVDILDSEKVLTADIQLLMQGKQLWKIFLILALIFLAIELILLRFWK
jgi:hypothetical protein